MTVLLLCGYRNCDPQEPALGVNVIDQQIRAIQTLGYQVICVLSGQHADDQLRLCPRIANVELVFDTQDQPNLATNLKAGLAATDGSGCFVLPVEVPAPPLAHWIDLREGWRQRGFHTDNCVYQMADFQGAPSHFGFPLIVTRTGNQIIRELQGFRELVDTRLKYAQLVSPRHANLDSQDLPL